MVVTCLTSTYYQRVALLLTFLLSGLAPARAQQPGPFTVPDSEHRVVQSKVAGHPYDIYVHLPAGYAAATKKYPVLYVVDGDNDFAPTLEYLGLLMAEYHIPEPLVVAIGDGGPIGSAGNKRMRDFSPSATAAAPESGGAAAFLGFIEQELIPLIETNYKADPKQRTYYGYSMGGLFGTYVLFQKPTLFQNILLGSPALGYDHGKIFDVEKAYHAAHADLPVHVFVEVGALETPGQKEPYQRLISLLQARHYQHLDLHTVVIDRATHLTGKPDTMLKALGWAYTTPRVTF
ncbi:MAG: alpha/beta hydrolase [Hymenobacter sp.]|nr:MAG: alpha/beta hydrolase [Hymenobacter sp.]